MPSPLRAEYLHGELGLHGLSAANRDARVGGKDFHVRWRLHRVDLT